MTDYTFTGPPITDQDAFRVLPPELRAVLQEKNGFILLFGALHVRGATFEPAWHSIRETWTGPHALSAYYGVLTKDDVPFGQDALGDQFILRESSVFRLRAETGEIQDLQVDLPEFLRNAQKDPIEYLELAPLLRFQKAGGTLAPGQLLSVYPPFCTQEARQGVDLKAIPLLERIDFLAGFSRQINHLQDGTKFKIRFKP